MFSMLKYSHVDEAGLHVLEGKAETGGSGVDHVIVCAGQTPNRTLYEGPCPRTVSSFNRRGGACAELDAKRAFFRALNRA